MDILLDILYLLYSVGLFVSIKTMDSENNKNQRSYEKKQSNDAIGTAERVHPDAHPSEALSSDVEVKKAQRNFFCFYILNHCLNIILF
jgi:hypothetical protein